MEKESCTVCVTGGAGYIGSWLVRKLLHKGYTVHATLRNLNDESKVGFLKSFENADTRLVLFEADIYNPSEFEHAINGCQFVFHVATPMKHTEGRGFKNRTEAAVGGARTILRCCERSTTVKKLIYTASVMAASPLKEDGSGYRDSIDETCWTPLHLPFHHSQDYSLEYTISKTLAEKEILSNNGINGDLEVVSLACGLVGGDTLLQYIPGSFAVLISQLTNQEICYEALKFLEDLNGKIAILHIDDVCEAHIFCMENPSVSGRFLCASSFVSAAEIANFDQSNYPEFIIKPEYLEELKREIKWGSEKLTEKGFKYKYDMNKILGDCVNCFKNLSDRM